MLKAFKYRLYPTAEQETAINQTFGVCRLVYNLGVEIKTRAYKEHGVVVTTPELQKQIKELREEYPWVKAVSREALDFSLRSMDDSFRNFFRGAGYPKFKRKSGKQSYEIKGREVKVDFSRSLISVPKIKDISIRISRAFSALPRTCVLSKTSTGKYFISILVDEVGPGAASHDSGIAIGIDLGISTFATVSTGEKVENPKHLRASIERLKILQRRASKKKAGSENSRKANIRIAILHERVVNQRYDFLQKASSKIVYDNQVSVICLETLAVSNMVKNRRLSFSIADASWTEFVRQLEYKALWCGKRVVKIGRFFPSSKTCSSCGEKVPSLPLSIRQWDCECGAHHDRDINAAINIRNSGMGSPGEPVEQSAMKGCDETGINVK